MSTKTVGQIIRELRLLNNLSQEALAKNICSQAQISKLEVGYEMPYSNTLYELSKKLGVDMNFFFDVIETPQLEELEAICRHIRDLIRKKDYKSVFLTVKKYEHNALFQGNLNRQFLLWHKAIAQYYLFPNQEEEVLNKLDQALSLTQMNNKYYKEQEIEILTSIATIYNECKKFNQSTNTYLKALECLKLLPRIKNDQIKIRVLYGLSRNLYEKEDYTTSQQYVLEGIKSCLAQETFYLLGELYYLCACNLVKIGDPELAAHYTHKSAFIFELNSNFKILMNMINSLKNNEQICITPYQEGKNIG